ncbi:MAG: FlgD immunoglobulin-like domain containing protein [Candidatus Krumholzibacteriia bacterium]
MMRMVLLSLALLTCGPTVQAVTAPSELAFTYHWAPSPLADPDGRPLAPADHYDVWLKRDADPPVKLTTVGADTTVTLLVARDHTYSIRVCAVDASGRCSQPSAWSDPLTVPRVVDVPETTVAALAPPFPNPFNPTTTIRYAVPGGLPASACVQLQILDARGAVVRELSAERSPGWHTAVWEGRDARGRPAASGAYLVRFRCGSQQNVERMSLIK